VITDQSVKVVRMLSLYCGGEYNPDYVSPVNSAYVLPLSPDEKSRMRAELQLTGNPELARQIGRTAQAILEAQVGRMAYGLDASGQGWTMGPEDCLSYLTYQASKSQVGLGTLAEEDARAIFDGYWQLVTRLEQADKESETLLAIQAHLVSTIAQPEYRAVLNDVVVDLGRERVKKMRERMAQTGGAFEEVGSEVEKAVELVQVKRVRRDRTASTVF